MERIGAERGNGGALRSFEEFLAPGFGGKKKRWLIPEPPLLEDLDIEGFVQAEGGVRPWPTLQPNGF